MDNYIEYQLYSERQGYVKIPEPVNFEEGNGNIYERDEESAGILKIKSNKLELHGKAYDFLLKHSVVDGVKDVRIICKVKDETRLDERWRTFWEGFINPGSLEFNDEKHSVQVTFKQGGLAALIDSRGTDDYDLINTISEDGKDIGTMSVVNLSLPSRRIFLRSRLIIPDERVVKSTNSNSNETEYIALPLEIDYNSDQENIVSSPIGGDEMDEVVLPGTRNAPGNGRTGNMFLLEADQHKTITLNGQVQFKIGGAQSLREVGLYIFHYSFSETSPKYPLKKTYKFFDTPASPGQTKIQVFDNFQIELEEGDSLALVAVVIAEGQVGLTFFNTELIITEDSQYAPSTCRAITAFTLFDRILAQITGEHGRFRSTLFGPGGKLEDDLVTVGWWVRGFPDIVNEGSDEERRIQFTTSFEDAFEAFDTQLPLCWFVKREGNKEYLHIEELKYAQQNDVRIKYGKKKRFEDGIEKFLYLEPYNVKRSVLSGNYYSSIKIGSKQGGNGYEEVFGLQSVSGTASFNTINNTVDAPYERLSEYAFGDVDIELPRRKPFEKFPDEDTRYDDIINVVKAKKSGWGYVPKTWQDIYEVAPTGIYDVNSAYNLELTPAQLLINHGYNIMPGLVQEPYGKIRWISSNCNSSLITQKAGKDPVDESGFISHNWLEKPRFRPMAYDFNLPVSQGLEFMINGSSADVANWYGVIQVKIKGEMQYFRLVKVDTNGEGTHKLVEAYM